MEIVVDLAELGWQIQPICHLAHLGYNPERSDESRAQLAPLPESNDAFPRRHLQENHIPDLELQVGSTLVGVTLLSTLSSLKPAPNLLDPLGRLEHHFGAPHDSLANFTPAYRGPAPPTVQHLKWGTVNTRVVAVVVRELDQWKLSIPTTTEV